MRKAVVMATTDWPLVKAGRTGELAKTAQYLLRHQGFDIAADGIVGPLTEGAIRDFQESQNLQVDGVVGNQTWPKLVVQIQQSSNGDAVRATQGQLRLRNLPETENLAVDGEFGSLTDAGVRAFQQALNDQNYVATPVDGIVGPVTWHALAANFVGPDV
jgi:peptidoglycan hydrolase-like protein with peptidoglycan-binding domain